MKFISSRRAKIVSALVFVALAGQSCSGCSWFGKTDDEIRQDQFYREQNEAAERSRQELANNAPEGTGLPNSGEYLFKAEFFRQNGRPWFNSNFTMNVDWSALGPNEAAIVMVQQGSGQRAIGQFKIVENDAPTPRDRVFYTYNFFANQPPGVLYTENYTGQIFVDDTSTDTTRAPWRIEGDYTHSGATGGTERGTFKGTLTPVAK